MKKIKMLCVFIGLVTNILAFKINPTNLNLKTKKSGATLIQEQERLNKNLSVKSEGKLIDIYFNLDEKLLKSKDESIVKKYIISKNQEITSYLEKNYSRLGSLEKIDKNDVDFIIFGLVYALAENGGYLQSEISRVPEIPSWLQCVGGVLGVTAIYDVCVGAGSMSFATTWGIVKGLVKKYVGFFGVALALWEIANECF